MRSSGNSNVQLCKLLQRNRAHNSLLYKQGLYYINIPEKNLKNSHDHAPLFHFEFLRHFSTRFGVIFIKRVGFEGVFLDKVGSDCALDALPTDGALGEGGGTLRAGDKVTAGQEHNGHLLIQADFTDGQVLQLFVFLFQHARISCTDRHNNVQLVTTASYKITCRCWVNYDKLLVHNYTSIGL